MAMPAASVVLVEDSVPYARLVELILADAVPGGVEVRHHDTVRDARADLRDRGADCILLDFGLPDANGLEALTLVLEVAGGTPVIVLSGHDDMDLATAAIRAGAQDYLVKGQERPPALFLRAIRFAIERRRHQERNEDLLRAKEDRWRTLTHLAPVGIVEIDEGGRCVFANDWVSELTGVAREALLGEGWRDVLHGDDARAFAEAWRAALGDGGAGEFALELRFTAPDGGRVHWAQVSGVLLRDPWGGPAGWLGTLVDVTPAREAREALGLVEQELRRHQGDVLAVAALAREAAVADAPVAMLLEGARGVLGAEAVELLGTEPTAAEIRDERPADRPVLRGDTAQAVASDERTVDRPVLRGDTVLGVLRVTWPAAAGAPGEGPLTVVELLAAELGAVLEQQRLLERLRDLARTDPLTGLANRRLWDERVAVELARAQRYERPLCVAAIDLDRFKPYNDTHGHQAGDVLLREATAAWRGVLRGPDLLSRWGGDEFALLLPDCDLTCAERIVSRLQDVTPGGEEDVGCSAGLVRWEAGESAENVIARADAALYAAKADGRGGIRVA
jgi:diguanylate cyclase (GGDEF)-like protein/PAS domain S-box-containing protein